MNQENVSSPQNQNPKLKDYDVDEIINKLLQSRK